MASIRFDITAALKKWRARKPSAQRRFRMMDLQSLADLPLGPGWFDSSWDLDQGLQIQVGCPGDPAFEAWLLQAQAEALARVEAQRQIDAAAEQPGAVLASTPSNTGETAGAPTAQDMLSFEPIDWKAWTPPDVVVDPLPAWSDSALLIPELALQPQDRSVRAGATAERELELVPM